MTPKILFLAVTLSASPTSQGGNYQYYTWGSWASTQYPPTEYPSTAVPYPTNYVPRTQRISRQRASSILTPTESVTDYCATDFREEGKRSIKESICNPDGSGYFFKVNSKILVYLLKFYVANLNHILVRRYNRSKLLWFSNFSKNP